MSAVTVARGWSYEASIPYEKPSSLEALHGPTVGTVQVDPTISTAPDPSFDLADRVMRAWLYQ